MNSNSCELQAPAGPRFEMDEGVYVGTESNFNQLMTDTEFNVVEFCLITR